LNEKGKKEEPKAEVDREEKTPKADHPSNNQPDESWKPTDHPRLRQEIWRQCWTKETAQKSTAQEQTKVGRSGGWREEPIVREARKIECSPKNVNRKDKRQEVDEHASAVGTNETTTALLEMCPKAIEQDSKARYMQSMPDKNLLAIEGDNGGTPSKNRKVGVVPHSNLQV
jgi:hypothetical protein